MHILFFWNLVTKLPVYNTLSITLCECRIIYICSADYILLLIQDAIVFVRNDKKSISSLKNVCFRYAKSIFNEWYADQSDQVKQLSHVFELFLESKIPQTKISSYSKMSLVFRALRLFNYNASNRTAKSAVRPERSKTVSLVGGYGSSKYRRKISHK